ncbi:MAG: hypothetical protein AAFY28_21565 [Actinomycetota bacterium]
MTVSPLSSLNLAVIAGELPADPARRELSDGRYIVQFDVTTSTPDGDRRVPITWSDPPRAHAELSAGVHVVVVGCVQRRFFRSAGATQSRTEVVATSVARRRQRRSVERSIAAAVESLDEFEGQY